MYLLIDLGFNKFYKVKSEAVVGWQKSVGCSRGGPSLQVNCVQSKTLARTLN